MSNFRLERGRPGVDKFVVHFGDGETDRTIYSEVLVWMGGWIPVDATAEWIETDPEFRKNFDNPDEIIPAFAAYLRAVDEARVTREPSLVHDLNHLTGWMEWTQGYVRSSRLIDEDILNPDLLEAKIAQEITTKYSPRFLPEEYTRLRRLGYKPEQIGYRQVYRPD